MPRNTFNTESIIPKIAAGTAAQQAESEGFASFLKSAAALPGVEVLSITGSLLTPERLTQNDLKM